MNETELHSRLSQIATRWSLLARAHADSAEEAQQARVELMTRYHGAAYRYILAIVRDADTADEVFQNFAVRLLRGDFRNVSPDRGSCRAYLKSVLRRLAIDHHRGRARDARAEADMNLLPDVGDERHDAVFDQSWQDALLDRAWTVLAEQEKASGTPYHAVLRYRTVYPEATSSEMAAELSIQLGRPFTDANTRQILRRARVIFAESLIDEVAASLPGNDWDAVEEELAASGLLAYCRETLKRRRLG